MKKLIISIALAIFACTSYPLSAQASPNSILGDWYALSWSSLPTLYKVDQSTGVLSPIGTATSAVGTDGNTGAAAFDVDATNGLAYFIPYSNPQTSLWSVNLSDGSFTRIGDSPAVDVTAMDIGNDGEIWVVADNLDTHSGGFGSVDKNNGNVTFLATPPERISALATSPDGVLYAFSYQRKVFTVDTTSFVFTQVGTTSSSPMAADFAVDGKLILQDWSGGIFEYDLAANTDTSLFSYSGVTWSGGEAFAVAGPTNGQSLLQAIQAESQPITSPAQTESAPALAATGTNIDAVITSTLGSIALVISGVALLIVSIRRKTLSN